MKRKVELLAPAGTPDAFYGAVSAGADAVYLAGDKFGARAYADNFTEEQLIDAIRYAHFFDVKVYMTVNTLFKNKELEQLADFLEPYYLTGLDGVIVQDLGVLSFLKDKFPDLERHVSTQMTVTSKEGAMHLKELGVTRVVPARELSLEELKLICEQDIEVESFIHGSMCYCYSGQCLFSSLIGGRSGNRGRCAQPCRLPYRYENGSEEYCFSLKDMCTLMYLPQILESGIASLKIEGRMKSPAYAAGVTAIYRKYINRYEQNPSSYHVDKEDLEQLKHLYIRSEIQEGYYRKQHGRDMITLKSPAYSKTDENLMDSIVQKYVQNPKRIPVEGFVQMMIGSPLLVCFNTMYRGENISVSFEGDVVMAAKNAPLIKNDVVNRFSKVGDSLFDIIEVCAEIEENVFLPVKAMNEARRNALELLMQALLEKQSKEFAHRIPLKEENKKPFRKVCIHYAEPSFYGKLKVFVQNDEQLNEVLANPNIQSIVVPLFMIKEERVLNLLSESTHNIYISLPGVCREAGWNTIKTDIDFISSQIPVKGYYANQVDSLAFLKRIGVKGEICGDIHLYAMNHLAAEELLKEVNTYTLSVELNADEWKYMPGANAEVMLYGRYPLMNTANCVFLTHGDCRKKSGEAFTYLKDRKGSVLPVKGFCKEAVCYNTVYNSVPTSLHRNASAIDLLKPIAYQIRFVDENKSRVREVLALFDACFVKKQSPSETFEYTNGHYKRGVE